MDKYIVFPTISLFTILSGCVKEATLEGGPKSQEKPVLISQTPDNNSTDTFTNPKNKKDIILKFNMNVEVKNTENIMITPKLTTEDDTPAYECTAKDDTVTLRIYAPLEANTTYNINFNNTITEIKEGQSPGNINVSFSTGKDIDSLKISGKVYDIMTMLPIKQAIVCLYKYGRMIEVTEKNKKTKKQANILNDIPDYIAITDDNGNYIIDHLRNDKYILCAGERQENKMISDPTKDRYGYISKPITINKNSTKYNIGIVNADITKCQLVNIQNSTVTFNKPLKDYDLKIVTKSKKLQNTPLYSRLNKDKQSVTIYSNGFNLLEDDKIKFKITTYDTIGESATMTFETGFSKKKQKQEELKINIIDKNLRGTITTPFQVAITSSEPILKYDYKKISLMIDKKYPLTLTPNDITLSKHKNQLIITKMIDYEAITDKLPQKPITPHNISIEVTVSDNTFNTVSGLKNLELKKSFIISTKAGSVKGQLNTVNNCTIQLLNMNLDVVAESHNKNFAFDKLAPGKYIIRCLIHKNSRWMCGNIHKLIPPDKVIFHSDIVEIIPNWEIKDINIIDFPF